MDFHASGFVATFFFKVLSSFLVAVAVVIGCVLVSFFFAAFRDTFYWIFEISEWHRRLSEQRKIVHRFCYFFFLLSFNKLDIYLKQQLTLLRYLTILIDIYFLLLSLLLALLADFPSFSSNSTDFLFRSLSPFLNQFCALNDFWVEKKTKKKKILMIECRLCRKSVFISLPSDSFAFINACASVWSGWSFFFLVHSSFYYCMSLILKSVFPLSSTKIQQAVQRNVLTKNQHPKCTYNWWKRKKKHTRKIKPYHVRNIKNCDVCSLKGMAYSHTIKVVTTTHTHPKIK